MPKCVIPIEVSSTGNFPQFYCYLTVHFEAPDPAANSTRQLTEIKAFSIDFPDAFTPGMNQRIQSSIITQFTGREMNQWLWDSKKFPANISANEKFSEFLNGIWQSLSYFLVDQKGHFTASVRTGTAREERAIDTLDKVLFGNAEGRMSNDEPHLFWGIISFLKYLVEASCRVFELQTIDAAFQQNVEFAMLKALNAVRNWARPGEDKARDRAHWVSTPETIFRKILPPTAPSSNAEPDIVERYEKEMRYHKQKEHSVWYLLGMKNVTWFNKKCYENNEFRSYLELYHPTAFNNNLIYETLQLIGFYRELVRNEQKKHKKSGAPMARFYSKYTTCLVSLRHLVVLAIQPGKNCNQVLDEWWATALDGTPIQHHMEPYRQEPSYIPFRTQATAFENWYTKMHYFSYTKQVVGLTPEAISRCLRDYGPNELLPPLVDLFQAYINTEQIKIQETLQLLNNARIAYGLPPLANQDPNVIVPLPPGVGPAAHEPEYSEVDEEGALLPSPIDAAGDNNTSPLYTSVPVAAGRRLLRAGQFVYQGQAATPLATAGAGSDPNNRLSRISEVSSAAYEEQQQPGRAPPYSQVTRPGLTTSTPLLSAPGPALPPPRGSRLATNVVTVSAGSPRTRGAPLPLPPGDVSFV